MFRHRLVPFLRLLSVLSIAAPAALFAFFAWHSYQAAMQTANDRANRLSAIVREHALTVIETVALTLERVDRRVQGMDWEQIASSQALWAELRALQKRTEQVDAIFISRPDGLPALSTRVFPAPPIDFSDRDYFRAQKEPGRGLYVGQAYVGKISREPIFNFSIRKSAPNGAFDGVVGISAYVSYFRDFYQSIGIASDQFAIMLLRDDGEVLVRYPAVASRSEIPPNSELLTQLKKAERGTFTAKSPIGGMQRIYGYAKARTYPVYAVYSVNKNAIVAAWFKGILPEAVVALLAGLALLFACRSALAMARQQQLAMQALDDTNSKLTAEMRRRERAESSLMQAQRLEAMGQLTGSIAHDFNNLLMVISGNLDLAERRWGDANALKRKLKTIRYATDRAKDLTQQLLGFARRHMREAKIIDLNDAIERARTLVAYSLPESVALRFELAEEECPVQLDVSELEAAILNLIGNARDAMPTGGTLTVATRLVSDPTETAARGSQVELRIADTGQGMAPEVVQRVFEPFFTTKNPGKGTGLGLSQVYGFVQQSGGQIDVQSEIGKGTCVTMRFARSTGSPVRIESTTAGPRRQEDALTILVVESKREVRQVVAAMLEDLGHQVLVARNSAEALALLHAGYPIDVLFADVTLSEGMSGLELARQAVADAPGLRVLLTTGHPGRADLLTQNDFAVLAKPYSRDGLAAALQPLRQPSPELTAGA